MIDDGDHREAMAWVTPFYLSANDIILADGAEADRPLAAARQARLLAALGLDSAAARADRLARARDLYDRFFALAEEVAAAQSRQSYEMVAR